MTYYLVLKPLLIMKTLIVAATDQETDLLRKSSLKADVLSTGVGILRTTHALTQKLASSNYDLCINTGIAGSYDRNLLLGEVVNVIDDFVPEEGAEDDKDFLSVFDLKLANRNQFPFKDGKISNDFGIPVQCLGSVKSVSGLTRITATGKSESVNRFSSLGCSTESMEGAAFFYVCRSQKIPCLQLRAISNYVEKRNRTSWKAGEALNNVQSFILKLLSELQVPK